MLAALATWHCHDRFSHKHAHSKLLLMVPGTAHLVRFRVPAGCKQHGTAAKVSRLSTAHLLLTLCVRGCLYDNAGRAATPLTPEHTTCLCRLPHHSLYRLPGAHRRQGQSVQSDVRAARHLQVSAVTAHAICPAVVTSPCLLAALTRAVLPVWAHARCQILPATATGLAAQLRSSQPACLELPGHNAAASYNAGRCLHMRTALAQIISAGPCLPLLAARHAQYAWHRARPMPNSVQQAHGRFPAGNTGI